MENKEITMKFTLDEIRHMYGAELASIETCDTCFSVRSKLLVAIEENDSLERKHWNSGRKSK